MSKYLVSFALAISVLFTLPADGTIQNSAPQKVKKVVAHVVPPLVSASDMAKWAKVNICETGGDWHTRGPIYSGGLGILEVNWMAYGGWKFGAEYAATPAEQIFIAMKIQTAKGYAGYVPDQNGCGYGW